MAASHQDMTSVVLNQPNNSGLHISIQNQALSTLLEHCWEFKQDEKSKFSTRTNSSLTPKLMAQSGFTTNIL
ncbi:hypothetical protein BGZ94_008572 [Podila epigama]|nr:hypothetical protein BGZ94_008572 [Podila epigama]